MVFIGAAVGFLFTMYLVFWVFKKIFKKNAITILWVMNIAVIFFDYSESQSIDDQQKALLSLLWLGGVYIIHFIEIKSEKKSEDIVEDTTDFNNIGFIIRSLAGLIDLIIFTLIEILVQIVAGYALGLYLVLSGQEIIFPQNLGLIILTIFITCYAPLFESSNLKATPGKLIFKLKVLSVHGNKLNFTQAFKRNICKILSASILFIGYLSMIFNPKKKTWHDQITNTIIKKAD
jgi:uncharacterized RDD family membrane protein YckC